MPRPQSDTRCSAGVASSGHPIKATCSVFFVRPFRYVCSVAVTPCESWIKLCSCQVLSRDLASTLSTLAGELSRSDGEDTLEEQTAVLLQLPCKLEDVCAQLCEKLQKVPLPALGHVAAPVGSLSPVLCSTPPADALDDHVRCTVMALSGNVVAEVFVLKGQPWLDAIPFGSWCHCWNVANFHLSDKDMVVFPRPRLSQLVPSDGSDIVLKLITSNEPPPVNIRVVIGKAAATSATYRPQPSTSPLYDFCELQTLMQRNLDRVPLRDVDLRCPDGPLAKRLRQRFYEMLQCNVKLGKRTLSEFRADESTSTYYLHVLVSSDAQRMTLRAKLLYDPVYLRVPVVEDGKVCPWNKPAFAEICEAIQHASV